MKKSFKLALRGLSIAAMLAFASNGFAASTADQVAADEAAALAAPQAETAQPHKEKKHKGNKKKKGKHTKKAGDVDATDPLAAGDEAHPGKHKKAKKKDKKISKKERLADAAEAVEHTEWVKNENSLTTLATKVTADTPKNVSEIAALTSDPDRRVALFRFQREASQNKAMQNIDLSGEEKEAFEALLLKEIGGVNVQYRQMEELLQTMKDDKHQTLLDKDEMATAEKALKRGIEEDEEEAKPTRKKDAKDRDHKKDKKAKHKKGKGKHKKGKGKKGKDAKGTVEVAAPGADEAAASSPDADGEDKE